jgi:hypothetical protein
VISVIPILCVTWARWLGVGRSNTNDCAGLRPDMAAIIRQNKKHRKALPNMGKTPPSLLLTLTRLLDLPQSRW